MNESSSQQQLMQHLWVFFFAITVMVEKICRNWEEKLKPVTSCMWFILAAYICRSYLFSTLSGLNECAYLCRVSSHMLTVN